MALAVRASAVAKPVAKSAPRPVAKVARPVQLAKVASVGLASMAVAASIVAPVSSRGAGQLP